MVQTTFSTYNFELYFSLNLLLCCKLWHVWHYNKLSHFGISIKRLYWLHIVEHYSSKKSQHFPLLYRHISEAYAVFLQKITMPLILTYACWSNRNSLDTQICHFIDLWANDILKSLFFFFFVFKPFIFAKF